MYKALIVNALLSIFLVIGSASTSHFAGSIATTFESQERDVREIVVGTPIQRDLAAGQAHRYEITIDSDQFLSFYVSQEGSHVAVALYGPDGPLLAEVNRPNGTQSTEVIQWITKRSGVYQIEVRAGNKAEQPGRYKITVQYLRKATARDREQLAAEEAFERAQSLRLEKTAESIRKAITKYEESMRLYQRLGNRAYEAALLYNIGDSYDDLNEKTNAIEMYQRSGTAYSNLGDQKSQASLLFRIGSDYRSLNELQKAIDSYLLAAGLYERLEDRSAQAASLYQIGISYDELGKKEVSIDYLKRALTIRRGLSDRGLIARTLYYLGTVHNDRNNKTDALECLNEALTIQHGLSDREAEADTLNYLGDVYLSIGENEKALGHYQDALRLRHDLGLRGEETETLNDIALIYVSVGETQKALDSLQRALTIARQSHDEINEAKTLNGLGMVYSSMRDYSQAINRLNEALTIIQRLEDEEGVAATLTMIAMVYVAAGDQRLALQTYQRAVPLFDKLNRPEANVARLFILGLIYLTGDEPARAVDVFNDAISLSMNIGEKRMETWCRTLAGLGYYLLDDNQRALDQLKSSSKVLEDLNDRSFLPLALALMASIQRDEGEFAAAKSNIEAALNILESTRVRVVSQDLRISFFTVVRTYYDFYIDLLMRMHGQQPKERFDILAFQASERARARSLIELLEETNIGIREGIDPELLRQERVLQAKLNATASLQRSLLGGAYTVDEAVTSAKEIETTLSAYHELQDKLRQINPRYADISQPQSFDLKRLQDQLDRDTLLLEYALGDDRSYLWLVSQTEVKSYKLPARKTIETSTRSLYELLTVATDLSNAEFVQKCASLSQMLLGPVASELGKKRLVIVADGALQYLPFAVLSDPAAAESKTENPQPLIIGHEIVSLPSLSVLLTQRDYLKERTAASLKVAIVADPVFSANDERVNNPKALDKPVTVEGLNNQRSWTRLAYTKDEADKVATLLPPGNSSKIVGFDARRELITGGALRDYRHILFATHADVNDLHPDLSAIVLSLVDKDGKEMDGYLRLNEIYNLKLTADVVVLSGCQTGLGKEVRGEGLIGLTRGFMYAGASRVITSLWRVDDEATSELIISFYRKMLRDGKRPSDALRSAQIAMLKSQKRSPHFWAAFIMQGEWR